MNLYAYVGNNPVNAADPSGFCEGGWGHEMAKLAAEGAAMADAEELSGMGTGTFAWLKAGAKMTLNDLGASLFGILDLGTGSGRVAGGDYSADAIIGAVSDVATVASVGAGVYTKLASGTVSGGLAFRTGAEAEGYLASSVGGESQFRFATSRGVRVVDQLADGVAYESKMGYHGLGGYARLQGLKDAELVKTGVIDGAEWHFYRSANTGAIGPSAPLRVFLEQNGIKCVIVH